MTDLSNAHASPGRDVDGALAGMSFERLGSGAPVVLLHSINAAASRAEMRRLADALAFDRDVWLVDLPGFGQSIKGHPVYDIDLYVGAIRALLDSVECDAPGQPIDVIALSLTCEFTARALFVPHERVRTVTLISPTGSDKGVDHKQPSDAPPGLRRRLSLAFEGSALGRWMYKLLTRPGTIRYFLKRAFGSSAVDPILIDQAIKNARLPGAERAPLAFLTGRLFSPDAASHYRALPMPVLIVTGQRGSFANPPISRKISAKDNVEVISLDTGGLPQAERPQAFAELWRRFIDRLAPDARMTMGLASWRETDPAKQPETIS
jgi:pimeloyl-ACP methyl ester carboxylesterase